MKKNKPKVGISIGDPNSIGCEIILKTLANKEILDFFTPVIFASAKLLNYQKNIFKLNMYLQGIFKPEDAVHGKINVVNLWKENITVEYGVSTEASVNYGRQSLIAATEALEKGSVDTLVAIPIDNNTFVDKENFNYTSIVDFFNQKFNTPSLPILIHNNFRAVINTPDTPLSEVSTNLNKEDIKYKIKAFNRTLIQDFCIQKPKIAVLSLNSFSEDSDSISKEDLEIIHPSIKGAFNSGVLAFGPYSADQFFLPNTYDAFDGVLCIYDDQITPLKPLIEEDGSTYLSGIPHIITLPFYEAEYSIAGQNIANYESFEQAVFESIKIYEIRKDYFALKANALKKAKIEEIENAVDEDLPLDDDEKIEL